MEMLLLPFAIIGGASVAIHFAASSFEGAADYLGRNLPPGVKGATLNAIASSLPEVFTTFFLLFYLGDVVGFASGLATCAGSAMFNMTVIPGLCLLFTSKAVARAGGTIAPNRKLLIRDLLFFAVAEALLLYVVGGTAIGIGLSLLLVLSYSIYAGALIRQIRKHAGQKGESEQEEEEERDDSAGNRWLAGLQLDMRGFLFPDTPWSTGKAWTVLLLATTFLGIACDFLANAVLDVASVLQISPFFSAVILAAAGTSIPDTLLSIRDAKKGNYEDALSNAFGSNIFNICIALGLPVLVFTILNGPLPLTNEVEMGRVQELCVSLIVASGVTGLVLAGPRQLRFRHGLVLLAIYLTWAAITVLPMLNQLA